MRHRILTAALVLSIGSAPAFATGKNCDELKMEIAAKIEANGVKNYDLTVVKTDDVKSADNVVGSCEGGTMKIVYARKASEPTPKEKGK